MGTRTCSSKRVLKSHELNLRAVNPPERLIGMTPSLREEGKRVRSTEIYRRAFKSPPGPRGAQCAYVTGHLPCSNPAGGWVNVVANIHSKKKKKNSPLNRAQKKKKKKKKKKS